MIFGRTVKVLLIDDSTNEVIDTIKFSRKEFNTFKKSAKSLGITIDELFTFALEGIVQENRLKNESLLRKEHETM